MAGPYTGAWRASAVSATGYTGISKWGTGVNPIHGIAGAGESLRTEGTKLNYDPTTAGAGDNTGTYTDELLGQGYSVEDNPGQYYGYNVNDPEIWGYGELTGTADRPSWGTEQGDRYSSEDGWGLPNPPPDTEPLPGDPRGKTQNSTSSGFPSWGGSRKPGPAGRFIRAIRRGGTEAITAARVLPNEDVAQGWTNKTHGIAADSRPSDDSQIFMQTSMTQRYQTRAGSQRSGSQSTFSAPIESRVVGQKVKNWTREDSPRHWDMLPYEQQDFLRPFLSRQAGTGYREWMYSNDMYVSPVIQREPPSDPELGPVAGGVEDYGYSNEDGGIYY